jgi:N-formylglutamate amidohydrolase
MNQTYDLNSGKSPLVISAPHVGLELPVAVHARLSEAGRALTDTDWYVDRLYSFAGRLRASTLRARFSRYVVDLNRDPTGVSLYPGARTTGLCATETFEGEALYAPGDEPTAAEIAGRRTAYWEPYHTALRAELNRVRAAYGYALLLDAHSIWGRLPLLFDGDLPSVNLGTDSGRSCAPEVTAAAVEAVSASTYDHVVDGRFKGGYITRHYGDPANGIHALQIELDQRTYLAAGSRTAWDEAKAASLSHVLHHVCEALLAWGERSAAAARA